jgi:hypothetical protein
MMILMMWLSFAFGATFETETVIYMDKSAPSPARDVDAFWNYGVTHRVPPMVVDSSWSNMRCVVTENGLLNVEFSAESGSWPTSWPSTVTCSMGHDGDTYTLKVNLLTCDDASCERVEFPTDIPNCSATNSVSLRPRETRFQRCWLPAPPSGKMYTLPDDLHRGLGDEPYWYGKFKKGSSFSTDDPKVEGLECSIERHQVVATGAPVYLLSYMMESTLPGNTRPYYCPIRLVDSSTKALSWGTPISISVDR